MGELARCTNRADLAIAQKLQFVGQVIAAQACPGKQFQRPRVHLGRQLPHFVGESRGNARIQIHHPAQHHHQDSQTEF